MSKFISHMPLKLIFYFAGFLALLIFGLLVFVDYLSPPAFFSSLANVESVSAESWLIYDMESGTVLYEKDGDETLPIASITKLVAATVAYKENYIWDNVTITWSDIDGEGRAGKLAVGESYMLHTLLFPLLLESSNDAAEVLLRNDKEFVAKMNAYTNSLGLVNTEFTDASGLSDQNVSTGGELATLIREIYKNHRHVIDITSLNLYWGSEKGWLNNNPLVSDESYVGGKHGYTDEAGYTAVAVFNETLSNGVESEIGYVVLKSTNLAHDIVLLRNAVQNHVRFE